MRAGTITADASNGYNNRKLGRLNFKTYQKVVGK